MIDEYARLLEVAAETESQEVSDAAVTKLIQHLKSIGGTKLLPRIAQELRKVAARRHALRPIVEVAHESEAAAALRAAAHEGIVAKQARVNTSLIHGWRARQGGKLIDRSAKSALLSIYQNIVSGKQEQTAV